MKVKNKVKNVPKNTRAKPVVRLSSIISAHYKAELLQDEDGDGRNQKH